MTTTPSSWFLRLPQEVRCMIYDFAFEDVSFSNMRSSGTAYSKVSSPLLYVHETISNDLLPRLYKNHTLVLPIQEPSQFTKGVETITPDFHAMAKIRKSQTTKIIVEASQKDNVIETNNNDEENNTDAAEDGYSEIDWDFWDESHGGGEFARKLTLELAMMKQHLPSVKDIKFIFWVGSWTICRKYWIDQLEYLTKQWGDLHIEVQLNLFDYYDPDAGDGGSNWIQGWEKKYRNSPNVTFSAIDINHKLHSSGDFSAAEFDPTGWEDPYVNMMHDYERKQILHTGRWVECRPLFVET